MKGRLQDVENQSKRSGSKKWVRNDLSSPTRKCDIRGNFRLLQDQAGGPATLSDVLKCLDEVKLFYTDWKDYDKEDAIKSGIVGPDHIKRELKRLAKGQGLQF